MKDELGWGGDTLPRGVPEDKISEGGGTFYPGEKCLPGTRYQGAKINRYIGSDSAAV